MADIVTQYRVVCQCGDVLIEQTQDRDEVRRVVRESPRAQGHTPRVEARTVTEWSNAAHPTSDLLRDVEDWLYKMPKGDTIHRVPCSRAPDARHWIWADTETDETVMKWVKAGIYSLCTRCKPLEGVS